MGFSFAPMLPEHEARVAAIQEAVYPPCYHEDARVVIQRRNAFPAGSFVAVDDATGAIVAYCQSYAWPLAAALEKPPALGDETSYSAIAAGLADPLRAVFFIHEVTVHRQGCGIGGAAMRKLLQLGRDLGFRQAMLVSVLGNEPLWTRFGFREHRALPVGYYAQPELTAPADSGAADPPLMPRTPSFFSKDMSATVMMREL